MTDKSVLGTYSKCEGENVPSSNLLGDHGNVLSSKKPKFVPKCGLHHT